MSRQEGITVKKLENFSEWYSQVLEKADLADIRYNVQGFIVHRPWAMRIIREIYRMLEKELEDSGHEPVLFPLVIPEENLKKEAEHFGVVPEVFWVTETGLGNKLQKKLALRPTSETAMYSMFPLWIRSHRDLPARFYQSCAVYRNEPVTRPFLRGREFLWIEAHDAFATHDEAEDQIKDDMSSFSRVVKDRLGLPITFFKRPDWDRFLGADSTYAADVLLPDGKVLQVGTTHDLGQRFSKTFGIKFYDKDETEKHVWQTSYGPGIWRIFAALVSIHGDDRGLVLPFDIAPVQIAIVPIFYSDKEKAALKKKIAGIEKSLKKYRIHVDWSNKTPGEKFAKWEVYGVPLRIEIGKKEIESKGVTVFRRDTRERQKVLDKSLPKKIESLGEEILSNLRTASEKALSEKIVTPKTKNDFFKALESGSLIKVGFCGREACAKEMQNETGGAKVRGVPMGKTEKAVGKCIHCNHEAEQVVYIARQY